MTNPKEQSTIPRFTPNQVLTDLDLTNLVKYIDFQSQLIRLRQLGAGIICGLKPVWRNSSLTITAGSGVSSEGFPIQMDEMKFGYCVPTKIDRKKFLTTSDSVEDSGDDLDVFELLDQAQGGQELKEQFLNNMVVVLLLEITDTPIKKHCADGCDQGGGERKLNLRKLLLSKDIADTLLQKNYSKENIGLLKGLFQSKYQLEDLFLGRIARLSSINSLDLLNSQYQAILEATAQRVVESLKQAHRMFSEIFTQFVPGPDATFELPLDRFSPAGTLGLQYLYGHLNDLILGYEEFRKVAFDLMDVCEVKSDWFPKHLFLGAILRDEGELPIPADYARTPSFQPPIYNDNHIRVDAAKLLYERLSILIKNFKIPTDTDVGGIRITPSKFGDAPLSQRAIPYYYEPNTLNKHWNSDRSRKGKSHQVHSYHRIKLPPDSESNPPFDDPLVYDFEEYNFLRIEGHLGLESEKVLEQIRNLRNESNLPFDIVSLRFGPNDEEQDLFHVFASKHPGMEHKAGVPRGGTFVIVSDDQKVVADFCLPYKCKVEMLRPIVLLERTTFCSDDGKSYKFVLSPKGGKLEGKGVSPADLSFTPNKTGVTEGTIEVTYTVEDVEAKFLLTILPAPKADFSISPLPAIGGMCRFQISKIKPEQTQSEHEYRFTWTGGIDWRVTPDSFVLQVPKSQLEQLNMFSLNLVVSNGVCRSEPAINTSEIRRTEEEEDDDNPLNEAIVLTDAANTALDTRIAKRIELLTSLGEQIDGLTGTSSFQAVKMMSASWLELSNEELVEKYKTALGSLTLAYTNSHQPTRKDAYRQLIETATANVLDGLLSRESATATRKNAVEQFEKVRKVIPDLEVMWQAWKSEELTSNFDAERIKAIDSLLQPAVAPPT